MLTAVFPLLLAAALSASEPGVEFAVAIERGDLKAVSELLDAGHPADTPIGEGEGLRTPLQMAAWNGRTEIAKLLIARGADVKASAATYGSPLHAAVSRGWDDLVAVLIEAGADVDQRDARGGRPIVSAVSNGNREATALLLKAGARVEESEPGYTPLMYAAMSGDVEMIRMLVKAGAKVNAAAKGDYGGSTPLVVAIERGGAEAVRALIELKADVNARAQNGETPLKAAQAAGDAEIVAMLTAAGATEAGSAPRRKP